MILFKKILLWLKHYWWVPAVGAAGLVLYVFFNGRGKSLLKMVQMTAEKHKQELDALQKAEDTRVAADQKAQEQYQSDMEQAAQQYTNDQQAIKQQVKDRTNELAKEGQQDPEKLTEKVAEEIPGISVYDPGKDG